MADYLLKEDGGKILLEDGSGALLLESGSAAVLVMLTAQIRRRRRTDDEFIP